MQQAIDVFEEFVSSNKPIPTSLNLEPAQYGQLFICNQSIPGLNLIQQLKGRRILRITGGSTNTYVFQQSSDIENTITALNTGQDDRIEVDNRSTCNIEDAIACLQGNKIIDISTGKSHAVILTQEGQVYSYGYGQHGVLGHGGSYFEQKPRLVRKLQNRVINQIACGMFHTLVLSNYGDVYAWGKGFEGQLGIRKDLECCSSPQLIVGFYKYDQGQIGYMKKTAVKDIACGSYHSMAIDEHGNLYCWGEARFGQTGNGRKIKQPLPAIVQIKRKQRTAEPQNQSKRVKKVSGGFGHTLCLTEDGLIYGWGLNIKGQIGINDISQNTKLSIYDDDLKNMKAVHYPHCLQTDKSKSLLPKFIQIACGFNSSFAIDVNGQPWGWGGDINGFKDEGHCERAPRRIIENTQDRIFNRIFANQDVLVFFAPVRTLSFNPILGPSKGCTQLTLFGTGFVETGTQKAKFTIGQQQVVVDCQFDPNSLTYFCKTPNFQDLTNVFPIKCNVSLSLDGYQFYPFKQQYLIYSSQLTAQSIEPKNSSAKGGQPLTLSIDLPELIYEYIPSITVGFRLFNKNQKQQDQKPSWICVEGIYKQRQIKCTIPKIPNFDNTLPYYHVDISINGQQFSGYPNTIRLYQLNNIDISPQQGYQQGNYSVSIIGQGLFDSSRKKVQLKVVQSQNKQQSLGLGRQVQVVTWDKQNKKYSFDMPPLTWLLCGNQATLQLIQTIKKGIIQVSLTLSGTEWVSVGKFKFIDPPPPPPEPQQQKDTKKGGKKAAKK